jgi:hypothetical protein
MKVLDRESTSGILIRCAEDTELAVQTREHHLSDISAASAQTILPEILRETIPEPLYDPEDALRSFSSLRNLNRQYSTSSDGFQKEPPCHPRRHAHLTCLYNDVVSAPLPIKPAL